MACLSSLERNSHLMFSESTDSKALLTFVILNTETRKTQSLFFFAKLCGLRKELWLFLFSADHIEVIEFNCWTHTIKCAFELRCTGFCLHGHSYRGIYKFQRYIQINYTPHINFIILIYFQIITGSYGHVTS